MITKTFTPENGAKVFAIMEIAAPPRAPTRPSPKLAGPPDRLVDGPPRRACDRNRLPDHEVLSSRRYEATRPGNAWVLPRQNAARSAELCMASAPNVRNRWSLTATSPR